MLAKAAKVFAIKPDKITILGKWDGKRFTVTFVSTILRLVRSLFSGSQTPSKLATSLE